ncbi:MarR family winged helix-turn-helix transcriptional regulator [Cellulomonas wangsupingiae]|uniref:MarR family winged helix-turn-helix transcriptional regulator n=1 Tax=Cellulomonas wangsupingiae TaxID=2968085 RepID=UPI003555F3E3
MRPVTSQPAIDPLAVETQVCLTLSAAARSLVGFYRPLLEPLGLTHPQYLAMLALWQHAPLSLRDLADLLHLEPATASPLVRRLERLGLVTRTRVAGDERTLEIALTATGLAMRDRAEPVPGTMVERLGLTSEQIDEVRRAAQLVIDATAAARP